MPTYGSKTFEISDVRKANLLRFDCKILCVVHGLNR